MCLHIHNASVAALSFGRPDSLYWALGELKVDSASDPSYLNSQLRFCSFLRCLHFLLFLALSADSEFNSQPKHDPYFVKSNDANITLPCSVGDNYTKEPFVLNWIKIINGSPRIITTASVNRMTDLYDLDTTSCGGCYNLRIKKITYENDNAKFFCQITGTNNFIKESQPAEVVVLGKICIFCFVSVFHSVRAVFVFAVVDVGLVKVKNCDEWQNLMNL